MKYLLADLLPKVFHGLTCIIYLSYTYNSNEQPKQALLFFASNYILVITWLSVKQQ